MLVAHRMYFGVWGSAREVYSEGRTPRNCDVSDRRGAEAATINAAAPRFLQVGLLCCCRIGMSGHPASCNIRYPLGTSATLVPRRSGWFQD